VAQGFATGAPRGRDWQRSGDPLSEPKCAWASTAAHIKSRQTPQPSPLWSRP
jgi:hypothetical protein